MILARVLRLVWGAVAYLSWRIAVRWRWVRPRETRGERLVRALEHLGTTFIKLGQGLSLRSDLLPDDYIVALRGLQDRVAPFPSEAAVEEIERAFDCPINYLFSSFEQAPLAAASIAQVHAATLRDGRSVVIKVRRPGVKEQVAHDMRILRRLVRVVVWFSPELESYRPLAIIQEIETNLRRELDFRLEARSQRRFAVAFANSATIFVPRVIEPLYTEAVIVQERAEGKRVDNSEVAVRGPQLARALMASYLHQLLVMGAFHADPHPGNLFVLEDGRLGFHDFGLVGTLDPATRRNLVALLQALMERDSGWSLEVYLEMGILSGGEVDKRGLRLALEELVQDYADLPLKDWSVAEVFTRIARMGLAQNVRLPHELLVLIRTMLEVETTARLLDPDFNPFAYMLEEVRGTKRREMGRRAGAGARARFFHEAGVSVQELPGELGLWLRRVRRNGLEFKVRHGGLQDFEHHIDRSSNRVALALVILGLYIASSVLMQGGQGPHIADMPVTALFGFALALWFTLRLVRAIIRSGRL